MSAGSAGTAGIHIWHIPLDLPAAVRAGLSAVLSISEQDRASAFRFKQDQHRWQAAHAALRMILSAYLGEDPQDIQFEAGLRGKPALCEPHHALQFNLSHSRDKAVVAVSRETPVGIDIQHMPDHFDRAHRERILSEEELVRSANMSDSALDAWTLLAWVRKEALLKAAGLGFSIEPSSVTIPPGTAPLRILFADTASIVSAWMIHDIRDSTEPLVCLAAAGENHNLRELAFNPLAPEELNSLPEL